MSTKEEELPLIEDNESIKSEKRIENLSENG